MDNNNLEVIQSRLDAIRNIHDKDMIALKREIALQLEAIDKALNLQTFEIARRLAELNGEAGRLKEMQSTYLPREKFDDFERRMELDLKDVAELKGQIKGTSVMIAAIVSMVTTLLIPFLGNLISK